MRVEARAVHFVSIGIHSHRTKRVLLNGKEGVLVAVCARDANTSSTKKPRGYRVAVVTTIRREARMSPIKNTDEVARTYHCRSQVPTTENQTERERFWSDKAQ